MESLPNCNNSAADCPHVLKFGNTPEPSWLTAKNN